MKPQTLTTIKRTITSIQKSLIRRWFDSGLEHAVHPDESIGSTRILLLPYWFGSIEVTVDWKKIDV
jgi:hypothetical protein